MQSYRRVFPEVSESISITADGQVVSVYPLPGADRELQVDWQVTTGNFKSPNAFRFFTWDRNGRETIELLSGYLGQRASQVIKQPYIPSYARFSGDSPWAALEDECLEGVLSQMKAGANLAVDLAESKQTGKLVKQVLLAARTVRQIAKDLRRKPWDVPAELWLTYRYGVMPLIYTTYDILDAAIKPQATNNIFIKKRATRYLGPEVLTVTGAGSYVSPKVTERRLYDSARVEYGFTFRPKPNGIYDWTSLNPFGIAWELVPLSFVADWFVNVGQCLSLWEDYVLFNDSFVSGYASYSRKCEITWVKEARSGRGYPSFDAAGNFNTETYLATVSGSAATKKVYRERIVVTQLPTPNGLRVRANLGAKRYADAASLLKLLFFRSK